MATIKTWNVTLNTKGAAGPLGDDVIKVSAHQVTVEPSGALTFWAVRDVHTAAILLFGFSASEWKRIEVDQAETAVAT